MALLAWTSNKKWLAHLTGEKRTSRRRRKVWWTRTKVLFELRNLNVNAGGGPASEKSRAVPGDSRQRDVRCVSPRRDANLPLRYLFSGLLFEQTHNTKSHNRIMESDGRKLSTLTNNVEAVKDMDLMKAQLKEIRVRDTPQYTSNSGLHS
ncbi:hypothetical protein AAF712_008522 [Marasmius tenuissimus]|uniref:Uncharacterized protein n=1 Tax=Marasmius tenuissimus TaxID=585030 RepID=A0ABR2ZSB7_9AGAR